MTRKPSVRHPAPGRIVHVDINGKCEAAIIDAVVAPELLTLAVVCPSGYILLMTNVPSGTGHATWHWPMGA